MEEIFSPPALYTGSSKKSVSLYFLHLSSPTFFPTLNSDWKNPKYYSFISFETPSTEGIVSHCEPIAKIAVHFHPTSFHARIAICSFPFPSLHWSHKWAVRVQWITSFHWSDGNHFTFFYSSLHYFSLGGTKWSTSPSDHTITRPEGEQSYPLSIAVLSVMWNSTWWPSHLLIFQFPVLTSNVFLFCLQRNYIP